MASDYEKIKADNIRDYGEKTHHLAFLGRLYTDRTHFVFELLQNAEDKNASRILFRLFEDRLEVQHDADIFDDRDVRGICGVGEGTKAEDLTKIGKFGIGFKAVYAYTSVPEVHSGEEHFCIEHYVRPRAATVRNPAVEWTTLFVFGFGSVKVPVETASREIAARLRGLTARTLLFLRQIKEIEYILPDGVRGIYLREEIREAHGRLVTVIGESARKEETERWIVFERPVPIPADTRSVAVEIGFKLEPGSKDKTEAIARVRKSPLSVFFPTEKQTQFGFLIQGPYRTTPARDNIPREDEWNATLVAATAALMVDALHGIKDRGLMTVAALNALPIRLDAFPADSMFLPIVAAVRDVLRTSDILPAEDGTYVAARDAKIGRGAELRRLLGKDQLSAIVPTGRETKWLSGEITQDRTPDLRAYLMNELDVEEVDPDGFARRISRPFLSAQSDEWFVSFYRYLSGQEALWRAPPAQDQTLKKPAGLGVNDLCVEFRDADELMKLLGINSEDQTEVGKQLRHATELGVSLDDIEFLKQHADDFRQWKQSLVENAAKPTFPVRTSNDPARRDARVSEQWKEAAEKEYGHRELSVRTSRASVDPHHWLVDYYTNDEGQMICQLCGNEMAFKKRNDEYYFVAMEAMGREHFSKEYRAQFLALCPVCAARYNEFVKSDQEAVAAIKEALINAEQPEISVTLGDSHEVLQFVEVHFEDMKTILREEEADAVD